MKTKTSRVGVSGRRPTWSVRCSTKVNLAGIALLLLASTVSCASAASAAPAPKGTTFSLAKLFTFLFLTLGPLKVLAPFWRMTRGRDRAFKRRLAVTGTGYAAVAVIAAAIVGVTTLQSWGISAGALQFAAGLLLFLVALQEVMRQYAPRPPVALESAGATPPSVSDLAFSLAFPMIVTPYGVALVITLLAIRPDKLPHIVGVTALVVALNLLAMLTPDRALKTSFVSTGMGIVGVVLSVLMMALGIQVGIDALRIMAVV